MSDDPSVLIPLDVLSSLLLSAAITDVNDPGIIRAWRLLERSDPDACLALLRDVAVQAPDHAGSVAYALLTGEPDEDDDTAS